MKATPPLELRELRHGSVEYEAGVVLRVRVLREPFGIVRRPEEHDEERTLIHLGAFEGERLVGTLLLHDQGGGAVRMRQVAVDFERQRGGVGKALVARSEELARERGFSLMVLHARETAVPFYTALGYEVFGEPFVEVTLPHHKMRKRLDPLSEAPK
ncbi:MAG TPA: GNAT family N-acetyltransferase [Polyangiaceae bacterium]